MDAVEEALDGVKAELASLRIVAGGLPEELAQELAQLGANVHGAWAQAALATAARFGSDLAAARAEAARLQASEEVRPPACAHTGARVARCAEPHSCPPPPPAELAQRLGTRH